MVIKRTPNEATESTPAVAVDSKQQQKTSGEYVVIRMDGTLEKHEALKQPHTHKVTKANHAPLARCVAQMQKLVDGTFERLTVKTETGAIVMYVNEDGKDRQLPVNPTASLLIQKYIVGDVFFGAAGQYGDGLTPQQTDELEKYLNPAVATVSQMDHAQLDGACRKLYDKSKAQYAASVEELKRQRPDCHVIAGADTTPYVPPVK